MPARSHRLHHFVAVAVAVTTLAACGDDGPSPDAAAFCALVSERAADVVSPTIRTELDIEAPDQETVARWIQSVRELGVTVVNRA